MLSVVTRKDVGAEPTLSASERFGKCAEAGFISLLAWCDSKATQPLSGERKQLLRYLNESPERAN